MADEPRYRVIIPRRVRKQLDRLPTSALKQVDRAITKIRDDPRHRGTKKLSGKEKIYRVWAGRDYRVIYQIRQDELVILLVKVAKRDEDTYRGI